ncbi:hypothetical protein [Ammoniphilus sp. YIM 78166]|uniref:hypothetical protein n=1 Tax=Ammoniphilus sp. YIM 78166 TaxID=1644106 RepID=UPI00106F26D5|nr:hypothetical protein [Ammoniphilus sp. YIM 78166]
MTRYKFHLVESQSPHFEEKDHIIFAETLAGAIEKFERKHDIEAPAYLDEPTFDRSIEVMFKDDTGLVRYLISW